MGPGFGAGSLGQPGDGFAPVASLARGRWRYFCRAGQFGGAAGLPVGLAVGLLIGFMTGCVRTLPTALRSGKTPGELSTMISWPRSTAALTAGLMVGLAFGLMLWLRWAPGRTRGGRPATALAPVRFHRDLCAPTLQFLEWARNVGLLRVTGIAYQCRHDSYQQWLAAGDVDRGVKTTLDAQAG